MARNESDPYACRRMPMQAAERDSDIHAQPWERNQLRDIGASVLDLRTSFGTMPEPLRPLPVPPASDRLDSWKDIAAFFGREVRTVQGWEKNEGLPVHRHQHARQGSVYAFKSEL